MYRWQWNSKADEPWQWYIYWSSIRCHHNHKFLWKQLYLKYFWIICLQKYIHLVYFNVFFHTHDIFFRHQYHPKNSKELSWRNKMQTCDVGGVWDAFTSWIDFHVALRSFTVFPGPFLRAHRHSDFIYKWCRKLNFAPSPARCKIPSHQSIDNDSAQGSFR